MSASGKWPSDPIFDDFKVIKTGPGKSLITLTCKNPACRVPAPPPKKGQPLVRTRPKATVYSFIEALKWATDHVHAAHRNEVAS